MLTSFRSLILSLGLCIAATGAWASPPVAWPASLCESAVAAAEFTQRVPPRLLGAIALVESGRPEPGSGRLHAWPWTINADGVGAFFASKAEAIAAVRALQARGVRSIDVGCMQVNLMYHPNAFASLDAAFDPHSNADYAARYLDTLYAAGHDWQSAIAAYHSQTPQLGADYRRRVMALWQNPDTAGWALGLAVAYRDFAPSDRVYGDFPPHTRIYGAFTPLAPQPH